MRKTITDMCADYLNSGFSDNVDRLEHARLMREDLEDIWFRRTGAFDELETEIDAAIDYLDIEIKGMIKND